MESDVLRRNQLDTRLLYALSGVTWPGRALSRQLAWCPCSKYPGARSHIISSSAKSRPRSLSNFLNNSKPTQETNSALYAVTIKLAKSAQWRPQPATSLFTDFKIALVRKRTFLHSLEDQVRTFVGIIGHAGAGGHRGFAVTLASIEDVFARRSLKADVAAFTEGCIHCLSTGISRKPRPYGATFRVTQPNEVIHFDFLSLPESAAGSKYILALKDGMPGYVELVEYKTARAGDAFRALTNWFKRFGVVHHWVSDQGAHFKNHVIDHLRKIFSKRDSRDGQSCRSKGPQGAPEREETSDHQVGIHHPAGTKRPEQHGIHRLSVIPPIAVFFQLPGTSQLKVIIQEKMTVGVADNWLTKQQQKLGRDEREEDSAKSGSSQPTARSRGARFEIGDFVLASSVLERRNKLSLLWRDPKRTAFADNDYTFSVQDLTASFLITKHHSSRLKMHRDAGREISEDFITHVHRGGGGHLVEKLLGRPLGLDQYEIQAKWIGVETQEASWEPARVIFEDLPKLVESFVLKRPMNTTAQAMWAALGNRSARLPIKTAPNGTTLQRSH